MVQGHVHVHVCLMQGHLLPGFWLGRAHALQDAHHRLHSLAKLMGLVHHRALGTRLLMQPFHLLPTQGALDERLAAFQHRLAVRARGRVELRGHAHLGEHEQVRALGRHAEAMIEHAHVQMVQRHDFLRRTLRGGRLRAYDTPRHGHPRETQDYCDSHRRIHISLPRKCR